jgi:hypothetical protein
MILLLNITSSMANAAIIELGQPVYGGNGCPKGSTDVFFNEDKSEILLKFSNYITEAGGKLGKLARKTCNVAIPIHLDRLYQISLIDSSYMGFVHLPKKATAIFSAETFLPGAIGEKNIKQFSGKIEQDFLLPSEISIKNLAWSPCTSDTLLRINTSMVVQSNRKNETSMAIIDAAALDAGITYHLALRECSE